jgi:hypothetical protein
MTATVFGVSLGGVKAPPPFIEFIPDAVDPSSMI